MYYVPYAQNHVNLYGAVVALNKDIGEKEVCVDVLVKTVKGEEAKPVRLLNQRGLEMLAFYQANQEMYPDEPFLINVLGHLHVEQGCCRVIGDSITYLLTPDVRTWGVHLLRATLKHYKQTYGAQPWLKSDGPNGQSDTPGSNGASDEPGDIASNPSRRRQKKGVGR